ncbi:MAG: hypothetical protein WA057_02490 [Candidatus Magasanikiibacteriota bacterium]
MTRKTVDKLLGAAAILAAIAVGFIKTGYHPDTMDCGSGMNGVGYCYNDSGPWPLAALQVVVILVLLVTSAYFLILGRRLPPDQPSTTTPHASN